MKEHFISFITPMVQAIREGRKTQTRRILNPQPPARAAMWVQSREDPAGGSFATHDLQSIEAYSDPYKPGDILKVKEGAWMWCEKVPDGLTPKNRPKFRYVPVQGKPVIYVADHAAGTKKPTAVVTEGNEVFGSKVYCWRYKIPRFLPAWAIRTRLEVVSVRMERLNEISDEDAKAEGVEPVKLGFLDGRDGGKNARWCHIEGFGELWESINGEGSWSENPWVRRIEFKPL